MSKAFTRENDDFEGETALAKTRLPSGTPNYMTADGAERLNQEMAALAERRRRCNESGGDAREEVSRINARVRAISQVLADAEVISVSEEQTTEVRFGTFVRIRDDNGGEEEYRIVGVDEVDLEAGWISWLSPLAKALLGKRVDETVCFRAPGGEKNLRVLQVRARGFAGPK